MIICTCQAKNKEKHQELKEDMTMKKHAREQIKYTMREITAREQLRLAKLLRLHKTQYV